MAISADNIHSLFSATSGMSYPLSNLAQTALASGASLYQAGKYDRAAVEFRRAISLDPSQDNAVKAYDLLAKTHIQAGKNDDAIKAYKDSIRVDPSNDQAHVSLGNIYFSMDRTNDALNEYAAAVKLNPNDSANVFSLGQAYLSTGQYQEAETRFQQVIRMTPNETGGYYALGQTYHKQGKNEAAIQQFQKAISLKPDFYNAYVDLGSAYVDLGQTENAQKQLSILTNNNEIAKASVLSTYIHQNTNPKLLAGYSLTGFAPTYGPDTPVAALNSSLSTAQASEVFSMIFLFNKEMDQASVQNPFNWSITKNQAGASGGAYNWGIPTPGTDTPISPVPLSVVYDKDKMTATVSFAISQNATADGTIDPSHITFQFYGKDAYGKTMNPAADQYNGISLIV